MGYYIDQVGCKFNIKKENVQKAWDALIGLFKIEKKSILDASGYHYSWIDTETVLNAKSFADAMYECRWDMYEDKDGNITDVWFNGEKYGGDEETILGTIAPFVEPGSYIVMQGEQGERWKWKFDGKSMDEVNGRWVFDDEEDE